MLRHILLATWLVLASAGCSKANAPQPGLPDVSQIESIRVDFDYMGWGSFEEELKLVPGPSGSEFLLRATYADERYAPRRLEQNVTLAAVQELLAAATAPAWPRADGVRAVAATVRPSQIRIEPSIRLPASPCTHGELLQLGRLYVTRKGRAVMVDEHYGRGLTWTDDYPYVTVHIQFRQGPPLRFYSNSQKAMMLPWYPGIAVTSPPESDQNWSFQLSRALQAIVPEQSRLHERLGSSRLPEYLSMTVDHRVHKWCDAYRSQAQRP